jgi:hypothetical protein
MVKTLFASFLALALVGCGNSTHLIAPQSITVRAAAGTAGREAGPDLAQAERLIRASIEKHIADYFVTLTDLIVLVPAQGTVFTFSANEEVSGLGGSKRFRLQGSFDQRLGTLKILHRASI